jgi:putative PEP-CTERM system histidine kinase
LGKILPLEILRAFTWFGYLLVLITCIRYENSYLFLAKSRYTKSLIAFSVTALVIEAIPFLYTAISSFMGMDIRIFFHVILAIVGLMLVEQLYRNSPSGQRWAIKFTCLGLGGVFILDFVLYSKALLFANIDYLLWDVRGIVNAIIVPLLAISLFRIKNQTKGFQLSRKIVFHSATLIMSGIYLILMSLAGFYIKHLGGSWGEMAQVIFLFLGFVVLFVLLFSGQIRALFKVLINKHFVHYRYDYREQWLKISKTLAEIKSFEQLSPFIVKTLADLVDSSCGGLWIKNEAGDYHFTHDRNIGFKVSGVVPKSAELVEFLTKNQWVIDIPEYINEPRVYEEIELSYWTDEKKVIWLIIPLYQQNTLQGFVVLTKPRVSRKLNWEDLDVLKMVGMQLTNAMVLSQSSEKLSVARQFEAYNRLSAFVVHDLKNVIAQIDLIVKNSEKHKHNPEFIDDAIETMENSVKKMENLVRQLKQGNAAVNKQRIDLVGLFNQVIVQQSVHNPKPVFTIKSKTTRDDCFILGEKEKISSVITHLIQNAQDATDDNGFVQVNLDNKAGTIDISIADNGVGMDDKFIYERLFKPFDTTKGNAGMGIGVYEAREYIREHGGSLDVKSCLGKGTTFDIQLPLLELGC